MVPSGLTAIASATDLALQKKRLGSGTTSLIIPNEEREDNMKPVKSLEESGLLIKEISETIKTEAEKQKTDFSEFFSES